MRPSESVQTSWRTVPAGTLRTIQRRAWNSASPIAKGSVPAASTRMVRSPRTRGKSWVAVRPRGAKRIRNQRWWITPGTAATVAVGRRNSRADSPRGCTERPDQSPPRHSPLTVVWTVPAT